MELVLSLALVTLVTLLGLENAQGSPGGPGVDPIPPQQLYNEFLTKINKPGGNCKPDRIKGIHSFAKCMDSKPALIDYGCRYYNLLSRYCFCCGQTCSYVEQGDVCTRFCLKRSRIERGQPSIIDLPFDWGDEPLCTPNITDKVDISTSESSKSEDLRIDEGVEESDEGIEESDEGCEETDNKILETRKDTQIPSEAKPPPMKEADCKGNNCPRETLPVQAPVEKSTVTPIDTTTLSNKPPLIKPDCMGGNCPRKIISSKN